MGHEATAASAPFSRENYGSGCDIMGVTSLPLLKMSEIALPEIGAPGTLL